LRNDVSEGAPICRWILDDVKVDIMPMRDPTGTLSDRWFELAVASSQLTSVQGQTIRIVTAPCFVAMKIDAFKDRSGGDYMGSHDIEDIITVVDGREGLAGELGESPRDLREFVAATIRGFLSDTRFLDSLPGHLPPDWASQQRLQALIGKLERIAELPA
jgi:hypothetical protein